MNLELAAKVVEDVGVVAGTALLTLSQTHDPATVAAAVISAPALRGLLGAVLSKGQERSLTGAFRLIYSLFGAAEPPGDAGDVPAGEALA